MTCLQCGSQVDEAALYCSTCGTALKAAADPAADSASRHGAALCPRCKAEVTEDAQFCKQCGYALKAPAGAGAEEANAAQADHLISRPFQRPVSTGLSAAVQPQVIVIQSEKSPGIAALLSFLIPGAGQIYNGELGKGILLFILAVISGILVWVVVGCLTSPLIWLIAIVDAYSSAKRINENLRAAATGAAHVTSTQ